MTVKVVLSALPLGHLGLAGSALLVAHGLMVVSPLTHQCKEGGFPQDLWLGVSADAVSVYKRGEGRPLEVFPYEHILSFGAPLANTYKIVVDERELLFETSEVRADQNSLCIGHLDGTEGGTPFPDAFPPVLVGPEGSPLRRVKMQCGGPCGGWQAKV